MTHLTIRKYISSDKQKVKNLYEFASIHSEIGYRVGPWEADLDDIEGHYFDGGEFLVGLVGDEIVAMGGYKKILNSLGQIRRMRVHPDYRRKGYAGEIIQRLEKEAKRNNISELKLKTSKPQKMAQHFYEKNGYIKMKSEKEFYTEGNSSSFEVIWYMKKLI